MENKLSCAIVRDLLPSYVDGLTSTETNSALEEHLTTCTECSAALNRMKEQENTETNSVPEVDYLKKVRKNTRHKSVLLSVAMTLLGLAMILYVLLYVGTKANPSDVLCNVTVTGNTLHFNGTTVSSGLAISRVTFSNSNEMITVNVYTVPKTFLNRGEFEETYSISQNIGQVRMGDLILWEDGVGISNKTAMLYNTQNPFMGNMPANNEIALILGVAQDLGPYLNSLQSSKAPYGWTLKLETPIAAEELAVNRDIMKEDSYAMLALIKNLGYVTWQYDTKDGMQEYTITAADATSYAGQDIKTCADSVSSLQSFLQGINNRRFGVR